MPSNASALSLARTQLGRAGSNHSNDRLATDVAHLILHGANGTFFTGENEIVTVVNGQATVRPANPHAFS